jgi:hypothetical protein
MLPSPVPAKVPRIGDTALRYMAALFDPRTMKEEVWVPTAAMLSQKTLCFTRGSFSTGTSGYGLVACTPQAFSDVASVTYSTSTTVTAGGPALIGASYTNTASSAPNSPFTSAQIGISTSATGLQSWRVVSQALYVKYADTELNRGGDMILFEEPSHGDALQYSYNTALSIDGAKRVKVDNEWQHVCWAPVNVSASAGSALNETAWSSAANSPGRRNLCVFVNSAGQPRAFDYEMYMWVEFVGPLARAPSVSFNDPIGFEAVIGATQMFQQLDSVLGMEGFVRAVEAQLANQSLPRGEPPHGNFVGLLPFLPKLAEMVGPVLRGALKGGLRAALPQSDRAALKKAKAKKVLAKADEAKQKKKKK